MNNKSIFASNLKQQLAIHKKSRREVCEAIGVSYYTFSDWVNAKKYPRIDKIEILAAYFGVQKSELIEATSFFSQDITVEEKRNELLAIVRALPSQKVDLALKIMQDIAGSI